MPGWRLPRRQLLWQLGEVRYAADELDLIFATYVVELPQLTRTEALYHEHAVLGLSTGDHMMALYRPWLAQHGILGSHDLATCRTNQPIQAAGQVVMHQSPPTAKGHHFITLEDEDGMINIIVRPDTYTTYRDVLRDSPLLVVVGTVQRTSSVVNLILQHVIPLTWSDPAGPAE